MVWIPHMLTGAVIAILLSPMNISLGLIMAFASHYILDALPHWDYENYAILSKFQALKKIWKVLLDFILAILFIYLIAKQNFCLAIAGGLLAILPDINTGFNVFFSNRISIFFEKIHNKIHWSEHKKISPIIGILIQVLIIILAIYLLQ